MSKQQRGSALGQQGGPSRRAHTLSSGSEFALVVDAALAVPGRDLVAVSGMLESGRLPPPGTRVAITTRGGPAVTAEIAGGQAFDVQPPRLSFALKGVRAVDVPEGARITGAAEAIVPTSRAS